MSQLVDVVGRAFARQQRRVVTVRATRTLVPDDGPVFGFAPVKMVSEEVVQALAFGTLDGRPTVVTRWNPLSRDASALETFADALDDYLTMAVGAGRLPRVWLPHRGALVLLELLGHRYRTNRQATDRLRRMGAQCRVLADEAAHAGQQVVIVATELLLQHVVTGQSPVEDRHLDALLAWFETPTGEDPAAEADRRALLPAAAMLDRVADDRIEALRPVVKKGGPGAAAARAEIEALLRAGALREWDLLVRARRAFEDLGLPSAPGTRALARESANRLEWGVTSLPNPPTRPAALGNLLEGAEYDQALLEDTDMRGDLRVRERFRRTGRVVYAEVVQVDQPRSSRHPCVLTLRSDQPVLRVRRGTMLKTLNGNVEGRVERLRRDADGNGQLIDLRLIRGVLRSTRPIIGARTDWIDTVPFDGRWLRRRACQAAAAAGAYTLGDGGPPEARPRAIEAPDLGDVAERLRRMRP